VWAAKEYLPPADAASVEQLRRKWHSGAWHHLMNELENLQSSRCNECVAFATHAAWPMVIWRGMRRLSQRVCESRRQRVHYGLIGAGAKGAGLASSLRFMTGYLSDAYVEKRGFQFAGRLNYAGTRTCKRIAAVGDVECFLQPMSNCTAQRSVAFHRHVARRMSVGFACLWRALYRVRVHGRADVYGVAG
jgi:hypothetical protein